MEMLRLPEASPPVPTISIPRTAAGKPLELADPELLHGRINGEPVAVDEVEIVFREGRGVVVGCADLILVRHAPSAVDVENGADVAGTEGLRHLLFGLELALALEDALCVLVLLGGAVMQARARREMGMAIEIAHVDAIIRMLIARPSRQEQVKAISSRSDDR